MGYEVAQEFKKMHWNGFRNTIGFPPERWYEVADSLGFLIQDEYPLWKQVDPKVLTSNHLANEYTAWMRERWNHPSVVIWDAQNESKYGSSNVATNKVRRLDLSNRPWDNGYNRPAGENDVMESHPYLFGRYFNAYDLKKITTIADAYFVDSGGIKKSTATVDKDYLKLFSSPRVPDNSWVNKSTDADRKTAKYPIIINEYEWLWLNRDGSPTTWIKACTPIFFPKPIHEKRLEIYAKLMAWQREFWRAHRLAAGVLYFCGLSYSRSTYPMARQAITGQM